MGGGSTQVSDLQGYCTHSGCQEGRPRESARGSVRERMGAWSVRGARAGGEARAYRVHDLPFMVRQFVPRDNTLAACTPRRAFVALLPERRCTRAVASVAFADPPPSPCLLQCLSSRTVWQGQAAQLEGTRPALAVVSLASGGICTRQRPSRTDGGVRTTQP